MSNREEYRADLAAEAQIKRDNDTAAVKRQILERQAEAKLRRQAVDDVRARRLKRAADRRAWRKRWGAWLVEHAVELLFIPVIVVPAVLAATGMAHYGSHLYGPVGVLLFVFSEGAMWACEAKVTLTRRQTPDRPVATLVVGTWIFAAVGAVMNYAFGSSTAGMSGGVVMALVSAGGVLVHQLLTLSRRRTRDERINARIARTARRRVLKVRKAAARSAVAEIDERGRAHLVHRPGRFVLDRPMWTVRFGRVTLGRVRLGRRKLVVATVPGLPIAPFPPAGTDPELVDATVDQTFHELTYGQFHSAGSAGSGSSGTVLPAETRSVPEPSSGSSGGSGTAGTGNPRVPKVLADARAAMQAGDLPTDRVPKVTELQDVLGVSRSLCCEVRRVIERDFHGGQPVS